jgi:cell fate regulator YaaT (PSP1 superfamily)
MNFVDCYYTLNQNQLIFNFTADDRIDFRNLAKKLAGKYKTRIELRQIGVRDKAKRIGGIGPCGLFLCCNTFLTDFNSVSINMAKNQNLALNPSKINGLCGRLYCCLSYEDEVYSKLRKELPEVGEIINKNGVKGKVISLDILNNKYRIETDDKGIVDLDG